MVLLRPEYAPGVSLEQIKDAADFFRIVANHAHYRPTTGSWSYPVGTGAFLAAGVLAVEFKCDVVPDEAFGAALAKIESQTAQEEATRRVIQPYLDDPQRPLGTYATVSSKPPWRHQAISWHWAIRTPSLYFAHKPGLGKTRTGADIVRGLYGYQSIRPMVPMVVQARYSDVDQRKVLPARHGTQGGVLIVCPRVVSDTWKDELLQYQNLISVVIKGTSARKRQLAGALTWAHIVSYGSLEHVMDNDYDLIIADEAHFLSNEETLRFRRMLSIRSKAARCIALSGTPVSNMLPSLWAQYFWLDEGRSLGASKKHFLEKYFDRVNRSWVAKPDALQDIASAIGRVTYFLKKEDALPWLPAKLPPQCIRVAMTPQQRAYYEQVRDQAEAQILAAKVSVAEINAKLMKLQQICQGWVKDDQGKIIHFSRAKLVELEGMLCNQGDLADRKVIVWCRFSEDVMDVARLMNKHSIPYLCLQGGMSDTQRVVTKDAWNNDPRYRVMIGMIQVGIGINLHAKDCVRQLDDGRWVTDRCSTAIYYGLDQSVTNLEQSMDRIHRGDQVEQCLYRFILSADDDEESDPLDPIDAKIYARLLLKLETSEEVFVEGPEYYRELVRKSK